MTLGNGLSDPGNQLVYSDYLYQLGLIDSNEQAIFRAEEDKGREFIKNKQWLEAFNVFDTLLNGDTINGSSYFTNATGFHFYFNYLKNENTDKDLWAAYIQRDYVRKAIHVGNNTFNIENSKVENNLKEDIMQSVAPWISALLSKYRVLIYNGQLDIIVAYPLTINYLKQLQFSGADKYKDAPRCIWRVGDDLAGYAKVAGNLTEVLVRDAGHMVPGDQPKWALDLITRFVSNKQYC